jgi:DNA-binding response OmpR family regulator
MDPEGGIGLTRQIRTSHDSVNPYVPIIMMSGFSSENMVFIARDSGITEFLVKPFNAMQLYRRIYQIIEKPRQFVDAEKFFGPDRRRHSKLPYTGDLRRDDDVVDPRMIEIVRQQRIAEGKENHSSDGKSDPIEVDMI